MSKRKGIIFAVAIAFIVAAAGGGLSLILGPGVNHTANTAGQPAVVMEVMDPSLNQYAPLWQKEIGRRFSNAVGVLCHGGEFIEDEWIVGSPTYGRSAQTADSLVAHFQAKYPGRTIVLLACNPGHLHLHVKGVYHATDSVWCVPDRENGKAGQDLAKLGERNDDKRGLPDDDGDQTPTEERGHPAPEIKINRSDLEPNVVGNIFEFVLD